ncbi:Homocysteine S-methyltransferase [Stipitochalara longipes BDJ]|nr:Homocysteine S-methyltransferase [Stipitochalara longipes BDJ]
MSITPTPPLPPLILLDGGLGTTLADRYGCVFDESTPLWSSHLLLSSSGQETLKDVQTKFANAGADVILSATYQAYYEGFEASGVEDVKEAESLMRRGVEIARAAADLGREKGKVALSLGAYGATMVPGQEYSGRYDKEHSNQEQLVEWHFRRIGTFMPGGEDEEDQRERKGCWKSIDLVAFETLPRLDEVRAVRDVMGRVSEVVGKERQKGFWISCVFPSEGHCLPDGNGIKEVVNAMLGQGKGARPMGVGINCTKVGKVERLVVEFEKEVKGMLERGEMDGEWPSLVLYPDGTKGEVYDTSTKEWVKKGGARESLISWDEEICEIVRRARERRLWKSILVGGCCKTTPDDIAKLRKRIDES